jgi:phage gp29-like protein
VERVCQIRSNVDLHLSGVEQTRRSAIVGKPWELLPGTRNGIETSTECMDATRAMLDDLADWPIFGLMQDAVSQPLSAFELGWDYSAGQASIVSAKWVHPKLFSWNTSNQVTVPGEGSPIGWGELRLWTEAQQTYGVRLLPNKWIIHQIDGPGDYPWFRGLGSLLLWYEGFKNFSWQQWMVFLERCATPTPVATMPEGAGTAEMALVADALANIGSDSYAVLKGATSLEWLIAQSTGDASFQRMAQAVDADISIAYLGHSGAATSTPGQLGGQDQVGDIRQDRVEADARGIENTIRRDAFTPFTRLNFGPLEAVPRIHIQVDALQSRTEIMDLATKAWAVGLPVDLEWLASTTGIQMTKDPAKQLPPPGPQGKAQTVAGTTAPTQGLLP